MENIILQEAIEYLRVFCFRNKKEMACEIGVGYTALILGCAVKEMILMFGRLRTAS